METQQDVVVLLVALLEEHGPLAASRCTSLLYKACSSAQAVVKSAGVYNAPPTRIPTALDSHTLVAVVRPCTSGAGASDALSPLLLARVPFQMEAAPRKPTPDGMAAETRDCQADNAIGCGTQRNRVRAHNAAG